MTHRWYSGPSAADVGPGESVAVEAAGEAWMVVNLGGRFYALGRHCTHTGDDLSAVGEIDGDEIECGSHGARFDIATGEARCLPATRPLPTAEVRIDEDGRLEIGVEAVDGVPAGAVA